MSNPFGDMFGGGMSSMEKMEMQQKIIKLQDELRAAQNSIVKHREAFQKVNTGLQACMDKITALEEWKKIQMDAAESRLSVARGEF